MAAEVETQPAAGTATRTVVHYEIPAADAAKLRGFYNSVFGWEFSGAPGMEDYQMASTGGSSDVAIFTRESADARPTNYISVESVADFAGKIEAHGGNVLHRFTVPYMGRGAVALDPEGNPLGIWQADRTAQPE